jgi:hypothetical protein
MLQAVVAGALFGGSVPAVAPICDTTPERLEQLVAQARQFRSDSVWATRATEWGWKIDDPVEKVVAGPACAQALRGIQADGYDVDQVAVVKVGSGYLVQPGERWDSWLVLDEGFRVLIRVFAG